MANVLVVDDEQSILQAYSEFLCLEGHNVATASDASDAVRQTIQNSFDVVVADIIMPGLSGMELLSAVRQESHHCQVVIITGKPTIETAAESVRRGAFDYLIKPINGSTLCRVVGNAVKMASLLKEKSRLARLNASHQQRLETVVAQRTASLRQTNEQLEKEIAERAKAEERLQRSVDRMNQSMEGIIKAIAVTIEKRDPYTAGHQLRVAQLARAIAEKMNATEDLVQGTYVAAVIHDLGKITVPAEILAKPDALNGVEYSFIRKHPEVGSEILRSISFPWPVADIVLQHHERMDGSGYPNGLAGHEILLEARILGVADVVEAMAAYRPYRPKVGIENALKEILRGSGTRYDADVVDACMKVIDKNGFAFDQPA